MCTAATYQTKDFYIGRTLDYEFSYGDQITITPRNYPFRFRYMGQMQSHYALIGMAHVVADYPLYYDAVNEKGVGMAGLDRKSTRLNSSHSTSSRMPSSA